MIVSTRAEVNVFVSSVVKAGAVSLDVETTGRAPFEGDRVCLYALHHPKVGTISVPVRMRDMFASNVPDGLRPLEDLLASGITVVGHNLVFDLCCLIAEGFDVADVPIFDTQYTAFLLNDGLPAYALKGKAEALCVTLLKDPAANEETADLNRWRAKHKGKSWDYAPVEALARRCEGDVEIAWRLHDYLLKRMRGLGDAADDLFDQEMRWVKLLVRMTAKGVLFDQERASQIRREHQQRLRNITIDLQRRCWPGFNPGAPGNVRSLCEQRGYPVPDTEEITLQLLLRDAPEFDELKSIIEYRQVAHALNSGVDPLEERARAGNGRIHASWGGVGHGHSRNDNGQTRTGRLRVQRPALQGQAHYDPDIRRSKETIAAPPGWVLVAIDLSQADIRLAAHYVNDQRLTAVLTDPEGDVHGMVASEINMPRNRAKRVVFGGGIYRAGDETLARTLTQELKERISPDDAHEWKSVFDSRFPNFKRLYYHVQEVIAARKYLYTWDRGRLTLGENDEPYKFWNYLIQKGVAQLMKRWMNAIDARIIAEKRRMRIVLQVHDEVVIECPLDELALIPATAALIKEVGPPGGFRVPFFYSIKVGERWSDMVPLSEWRTQPSEARTSKRNHRGPVRVRG